MSYDFSFIRETLASVDNGDFKKHSDISSTIISIANASTGGEFDSTNTTLSEKYFISVVSCCFYIYESVRTIALNGGTIAFQFQTERNIHPESTIPRNFFLISLSENDEKIFQEYKNTFDNNSEYVLGNYLENRSFDSLYENLGINSFLSKSQINDIENRIHTLNGIVDNNGFL